MLLFLFKNNLFSISFSFWIKPTWGHTGSNSSCTWTSGFGTVMPLLQINGAGTGSLDGSDRAILMYIKSSSSGFRNRFTAWVDDGDDRSGTQRALHICGLFYYLTFLQF